MHLRFAAIVLVLLAGCGDERIQPTDQGCQGFACVAVGEDPSGADGGCTPFCSAKLCGDDGCGGSCGACAAGEECNGSGLCATPDCQGKACGPDGAGGSCGTCADPLVCDPTGQCVTCVRSCDGMTCGEDGCGSVCGRCADDEYCTDSGSCAKADGNTYTRTRYPIVLAHGMMGFQKLFGEVEYFYGIPEALRDGGATVYVTDVSGADDSVTRGEQLLAQVEQIIATSGASRVNLVSHSQGGLDARYVAAVRPDLVASLTAVAGPHQGSELATFFETHLAPDGTFINVASDLTGVLAEVIKLVSGASDPEDGKASLHALSAAGAQDFNKQFPAGLPTTPCGSGPAFLGHMGLWSWGGDSPVTNPLDVSDPWFLVTSRFFSEKNDGLVGRCSTHFGTVLRDDYRMNHLDEMNQFLGLVSPFEVSPVEVYRIQANRLREAGF